MEKYVTSLKELIAQSSTKSYEINEGAMKNEQIPCFQMGMVNLLGINTTIDFKKARSFFENQSLVGDSDAQRMLGLISELEGDYSSAFKNYTIAAGGSVDGSDNTYIEKVIQEREIVRDILNKWKLPVRVLNNTITTILGDYKKGSTLREKACIEIAAICQDVPSCINVAKILCDSGDYSGAMQWLQIGNVGDDNPTYQMIETELRGMNSSIQISNVLQIIEIEGNSLLSEIDIKSIFAPAITSFNEIAIRCSKLWIKEVLPIIEKIQKKWEKEEKARIQRKEDEKRHEINQAKLLEQEEKTRKKKHRDKIISIVLVILFSPMFLASIFANMGGGQKILAFFLFALLPLIIVRWIVIKVVDFFKK